VWWSVGAAAGALLLLTVGAGHLTAPGGPLGAALDSTTSATSANGATPSGFTRSRPAGLADHAYTLQYKVAPVRLAVERVTTLAHVAAADTPAAVAGVIDEDGSPTD
jgi:hypothetical protein